MARYRLLALLPLLGLGLLASSTLVTAQSSAPSHTSQVSLDKHNPNSATSIGNIVDAIIQTGDITALNNLLNGALNGNTLNLNVLNLRDVLNGNQVHVLSDILNQSQVLSNNIVTLQNFLNGVLNGSLNNLAQNALQNFLNNNHLAIGQVVGLALLNGSPVLIVL